MNEYSLVVGDILNKFFHRYAFIHSGDLCTAISNTLHKWFLAALNLTLSDPHDALNDTERKKEFRGDRPIGTSKI